MKVARSGKLEQHAPNSELLGRCNCQVSSNHIECLPTSSQIQCSTKVTSPFLDNLQEIIIVKSILQNLYLFYGRVQIVGTNSRPATDSSLFKHHTGKVKHFSQRIHSQRSEALFPFITSSKLQRHLRTIVPRAILDLIIFYR